MAHSFNQHNSGWFDFYLAKQVGLVVFFKRSYGFIKVLVKHYPFMYFSGGMEVGCSQHFIPDYVGHHYLAAPLSKKFSTPHSLRFCSFF